MLSTDLSPPVQLSCTTLPSARGNLQTLAITLTNPQTLVRPACLPALSLPTDLNLEREVILYGRSPTWLYGYLIHRCHAAPWLGCYDARSREIVVIHSRVSTPQVGDTLAIAHAQQPCPAILIGGPPNSGKSVLSNALRLDLTAHCPQSNIFLHRASWDGEGNWAYETNQPEWVERLVQGHEYRLHTREETAKLIPDYFRYHADAVENLRTLVDCLLVDVGGSPQPEKLPLVKQCTHYIVISRLPEEVDKWHALCQPHLTPLAVIHSTLDTVTTAHQTTPWLEMEAGPWLAGQTTTVPPALLHHVLSHLLPNP